VQNPTGKATDNAHPLPHLGLPPPPWLYSACPICSQANADLGLAPTRLWLGLDTSLILGSELWKPQSLTCGDFPAAGPSTLTGRFHEHAKDAQGRP